MDLKDLKIDPEFEEKRNSAWHCYIGGSRNTDEKVMERIPGEISRRQYYREKKEAIRMLGYYFFEVVIPQIHRTGNELAVM